MLNHLINTCILSLAYITAYSLNLGFFMPLQEILAPNFSKLVALIFLPHGIRVLAFVFYGWKAAIYLTPGVYLMWLLSVFGNNIGLNFLAPMVSLAACWVACIVKPYIFTTKPGLETLISWKNTVLVGFLATILNGTGLSLLHNQSLSSDLLGYIIGDMVGLAITLLVLMLIFRFLRMYRTNDW